MSTPSKMNLFNTDGQVLAQIHIPEPKPGIVVWNGFYFHLENGRYVLATVWHHIG